MTLLSVCMFVPPKLARQRLSKYEYVSAATKTCTRMEEILDAVFHVRSLWYEIVNM
jgi:hypothetical protein